MLLLQLLITTFLPFRLYNCSSITHNKSFKKAFESFKMSSKILDQTRNL